MGKLQVSIRNLFGAASIDDVNATILQANADTREITRHALRDIYNRENELKATEARIATKFRELDKAEERMKQVAVDMTLALYDAVEKIMAEIAEAKRAIEKEKPVDKP